MKIDCQHFSRERDRGQGNCALGLYGGKPWTGNCLACIKSGHNNEVFSRDLLAKSEISHPSGILKYGTARLKFYPLNKDGTRCPTCKPIITH